MFHLPSTTKAIVNLALLFMLGASQLYTPSTKPIVLDGQYSQRTDEMSLQIIGEQVCFIPDKAQWGRLPRLAAATHDAWFCFSNGAEARKLLRVPARQQDNCGWQARARIIIDTYQPYLEEGDGHDMARLASVDKVAQPNAIACE